jgi:hypothetical protein
MLLLLMATDVTEIRSVGAAVIHADRQAEGHDEANTRFSRLCESA